MPVENIDDQMEKFDFLTLIARQAEALDDHCLQKLTELRSTYEKAIYAMREKHDLSIKKLKMQLRAIDERTQAKDLRSLLEKRVRESS